MCLENCLMIGVMMPVGVSCLSSLLARSTEKAHTTPLPHMFPHMSPAIQRRPIMPMSIRITPRLQICYRRCVRHHVSPCRTAFSCPSIMSAVDIQTWCDVAFTKGHARHLRSICISRTGSRHMGAGIGHYPYPPGALMLWGFVSRIVISLFRMGKCSILPGQFLSRSAQIWFRLSIVYEEKGDDRSVFVYKRCTLSSHAVWAVGDKACLPKTRGENVTAGFEFL